MTEDEAKTKWCPMTNGQGTAQDNKCIASDCMWWVWDDETHIPANQRTNGGHCGAIK